MPKVSVIIPVYGVEKYIERCVLSLFNQTLDDIEYLFIDDCTPDKSIEIIQRVLEEYPTRKKQVIIHRMEVNSGQAAVRKWGMQNASGDYIIHCDSDDWIDEDMYRRMYECAINENADIVLCDYFQTDGIIHKKQTDNIKNNSSIFQSLISKHTHSVVWNKLVKKELYNGILFYPEENMGEDFVITIQLAAGCKNVSKVSSPLYYYNYNPTSITKTKGIDDVKKRFFQAKKNTDIVCSFVRYKYNNSYENELMALKINTKLLLIKKITNKSIFKIWKENYQINIFKLIRNSQLSLRDKLRYLSVETSMYSLLIRLHILHK